MQELRNTGSRAEDTASEKDGSPRDEVLWKSTPADEKEACGGSKGRKPEWKIARGARDAASEKDDTGREPTDSVHPKDERAAEEYTDGREERARRSRDVKSGRKAARGEGRELGSGEPYFS